MRVSIDSPPSEERRTRKRKSYSCVPCRKRKKQCDRQVPGCSQCKLRGEVHLCQWGDERDEKEEQSTLQRARLNEADTLVQERFVDRNESNNLFETLSRADIRPIDHSPAGIDSLTSPGLYTGVSSSKSTFSEGKPLSSRTSDASRSAHLDKGEILTCDQARHLIYCYREHAIRIVTWIDVETACNALDEAKSNNVEEIRPLQPDVYAMIMLICSSALILLPPTFSITLGIISKSEEIAPLLDRYEAKAFEALDQQDMFSHPTLVGLQALSLYQINLSPRAPPRLHIIRMDEFLRACRRMGLDKLGSASDDERLWLEEDLKQAETPASIPALQASSFAGETFIKRQKLLRNKGRAVWSLAVMKDWISARISGSITIHPNSFNTTQPSAYSGIERGVTEEEEIIWSFMVSASECTLQYYNICSEAQALGKMVDYEKILQLDNILMLELQRRPDWLCPEKENKTLGRDWRSTEAILVSTTLWNRLYSLHRPFLALSRSEPEKYGLSSSRSFDYAILCIRIMKEGTQNGVLLLKQLTFHFRLLQSALVVITHLFLGDDCMSMKETIAIHDDLNFVISTFKQLNILDPGDFFQGQGEKLEALLASAAIIKKDKMRGLQGVCALRDRSTWPPLPNEAATIVATTENFTSILSQEDTLLSLEEHLLKLSQAWPVAREDDDINNVWHNLFSVLDSSNVAS